MFSASGKIWYQSSTRLRSTARTAWPCASRSRTRCPPMNPPAPVTNTNDRLIVIPPRSSLVSGGRGRTETPVRRPGQDRLELLADRVDGKCVLGERACPSAGGDRFVLVGQRREELVDGPLPFAGRADPPRAGVLDHVRGLVLRRHHAEDRTAG